MRSDIIVGDCFILEKDGISPYYWLVYWVSKTVILELVYTYNSEVDLDGLTLEFYLDGNGVGDEYIKEEFSECHITHVFPTSEIRQELFDTSEYEI